MPDAPSFYLRPATATDQPAIREMVFAILAEHQLQPAPDSTDVDLTDLQGHYVARGGCFDVIETAQGEIVGSVGLQPQSAGVCELRKMYVKSTWRGHGLGRRLLDHALSQARQLGFSEVRLETAAVLATAVRMYENAGFRPYEPAHKAERCDAAYRLFLKGHD